MRNRTEENETPQDRTTDLCKQDAIGNTDQNDLGEAVLWKKAVDLSVSGNVCTKWIGLLDCDIRVFLLSAEGV